MSITVLSFSSKVTLRVNIIDRLAAVAEAAITNRDATSSQSNSKPVYF